MLRTIFVSAVLSIGLLPALASAQQVPEGVVLIAITDAKLRSANGITGIVPRGEIVLAVGEVKDGRLSVIYSGRHGTLQGSISRSDVIPLSQALDFYKEQLKRSPTASAYTHRSFAWLEKGQFDKAFADCNGAIRLDPTDAGAYDARGIAWQEKGDSDRAISDFSTAIRLDPRDVTAYLSRARAQKEKRQFEKAIADYAAVIRLDPQNPVANDELRNLRQVKAKFDDCDRAIRLDPKDPNAYDRRGSAWMTIGQSDKAIADWSEAIRLDPNDVSAYKTRGSAWMEKGQYGKAIADWSEVIRLNPELTLAYNNRAYACLKKGESDKAIADWTAAIRIDPNDASAYNNRGSAWLGKERYDKALADYNAAIKIDPKFGEAYWGLASLFATCPNAKYRDAKKAVENAEMAAELLGLTDSRFVAVLAAAYAEAGDFDSATKWQEKAVELAPEKSKADERFRLDLYKAHRPYRAQLKR